MFLVTPNESSSDSTITARTIATANAKINSSAKTKLDKFTAAYDFHINTTAQQSQTVMSHQLSTILITITCVVIVVIATTGLVCYGQFCPNEGKQSISEQSATYSTILNQINPESQNVQPEGGNNIEPAYISQPLQDDQQNHGVSIMSTQAKASAHL